MSAIGTLLAPSSPFVESQPEAFVCHCFKVTESAVKRAIHVFQATEVEEVMEITNAGGGCRACHCRISRLIEGRPAECGRLCEILGQCAHLAVAPTER
jgi:NAD(P)H-nitrite reductase large subunit